jgi:hypothetical protein
MRVESIFDFDKDAGYSHSEQSIPPELSRVLASARRMNAELFQTKMYLNKCVECVTLAASTSVNFSIDRQNQVLAPMRDRNEKAFIVAIRNLNAHHLERKRGEKVMRTIEEYFHAQVITQDSRDMLIELLKQRIYDIENHIERS